MKNKLPLVKKKEEVVECKVSVIPRYASVLDPYTLRWFIEQEPTPTDLKAYAEADLNKEQKLLK